MIRLIFILVSFICVVLLNNGCLSLHASISKRAYNKIELSNEIKEAGEMCYRNYKYYVKDFKNCVVTNKNYNLSTIKPEEKIIIDSLFLKNQIKSIDFNYSCIKYEVKRAPNWYIITGSFESVFLIYNPKDANCPLPDWLKIKSDSINADWEKVLVKRGKFLGVIDFAH